MDWSETSWVENLCHVELIFVLFKMLLQTFIIVALNVIPDERG